MHRKNYFFWIYGVFATAIFVFLLAKAWLMPFVLDEATTFVEFVQTDLLWPGDSHWTTNNHLLNTALTWVCYHLFGDAPFALRLPNLVAYLVYAWSVYQLAIRLSTGWLRYVFAAGMYGSMFIIEFFAMSRGYGLSFAFLLLAVVLWLKRLNPKKTYWGAEIALFFGMAANMSLLYVWPAFWLLTAWRDVFLLHFSWKKTAARRLISVLIAAPNIYYAYLVNQNFTFDLGEKATIAESYYSHLYTLTHYFTETIGWFLPITLLVFAVAISTKKIDFKTELIFTTALFGITTTVYLALYFLIGAPLPITRVGLHLFLLWFPALLFLADNIRLPLKPILPILAVGFTALLWADALKSGQFRWHKDINWQHEQLQPEVIAELEKPRYKGKLINAEFGLRSQLRYHILKNPEKFPFVNSFNFPVEFADFLLVGKLDTQKIPNHFLPIVDFEKTAIYRNTHPLQLQWVKDTIVQRNIDPRGFHNLLSINTTETDLLAKISIKFLTAQHSQLVLLCSQATLPDQTTIFWQAEELNYYYHEFNQTEITFYLPVNNLPEGQKAVSFYVWSQKSVPIEGLKASVAVYAPKMPIGVLSPESN